MRLTYRLELDTTIAVPDAIARRLIDFNLPTALRQFKARIETGLGPELPTVAPLNSNPLQDVSCHG